MYKSILTSITYVQARDSLINSKGQQVNGHLEIISIYILFTISNSQFNHTFIHLLIKTQCLHSQIPSYQIPHISLKYVLYELGIAPQARDASIANFSHEGYIS